MSPIENENHLQNSIENYVFKEMEKKFQNSDHNVTKSNVDDNEEFFNANCSIPDKMNIKEKDAPGKVASPKNDNTTLGNNNGNRNEHQDNSKEEEDVIENESNKEHIIEVVDNTYNLVAKNNVVD